MNSTHLISFFGELSKHQDKLLQFLSLTSEQLEELKSLVTKNVTFISESQVSDSIWTEAAKLTENIDPNDIVFVALANHLEARLWTGDKKLLTGLAKKGYLKVVNTETMIEIRNSMRH